MDCLWLPADYSIDWWIAYTWSYRWQKIESIEFGNRLIDKFLKEVNDIHIYWVEFSLLGETVLDWEDNDLEYYHEQRIVVDGEVLTDTEKVSGEVIVEHEVLDFALDSGGGNAGIIPQAGAVADLGVETLTSGECFVFLDERENVERHLVVAAPRHIREAIINDSRHDIHVLLENGSGVYRKRSASLEAGQVFNGVKIEVGKRKVHNLLNFSAKLWAL